MVRYRLLCPLYQRSLSHRLPNIQIFDIQKKSCEYKFYTEFQSHEPEFDYLKSLEIEEKINKIRWCKRQNSAHFLLSTNGTSALDSHFHLLIICSQIRPSNFGKSSRNRYE